MNVDNKNRIAVIANKFIQSARYKLTVREQRLILYMATLIKPDDSDFKLYLVPISDIKNVIGIKERYSGTFYEWLKELTASITKRQISFPSGFSINGVELDGYINWVSSAIPKVNNKDELCIEFSFGPAMKPILLGLKNRFTKFSFSEISKIRSGFSIRIYQMCKTYYNENEMYGRDCLVVEVLEFKERLGIANKYPRFCDFNRRVLQPSIKEINKETSISLKLEIKRNYKRKPISLCFKIARKNGILHQDIEKIKENDTQLLSDFTLSTNAREKLSKKLTKAQLIAYDKLIEYGVNKQIILAEILPLVKSSVLVGFEDYYIKNIIAFFEQKTNRVKQEDKIKAFVGWIRNKRFQEGNLNAKITEDIIQRKKKMTDEERRNRERAQSISDYDFNVWIREEKNKKRNKVAIEEIFTSKEVVNPLAELLKQEVTLPKQAKAPFNYNSFVNDYSAVHTQISQDIKAQFISLLNVDEVELMKKYESMLLNSIVQRCEQYYEKNVGR